MFHTNSGTGDVFVMIRRNWLHAEETQYRKINSKSAKCSLVTTEYSTLTRNIANLLRYFFSVIFPMLWQINAHIGLPIKKYLSDVMRQDLFIYCKHLQKHRDFSCATEQTTVYHTALHSYLHNQQLQIVADMSSSECFHQLLGP